MLERMLSSFGDDLSCPSPPSLVLCLLSPFADCGSGYRQRGSFAAPSNTGPLCRVFANFTASHCPCCRPLVRDCQARYVSCPTCEVMLTWSLSCLFSCFSTSFIALKYPYSKPPHSDQLPATTSLDYPQSVNAIHHPMQPLRRSRRSSSRALPAPPSAVTSRRLAVSSVSNCHSFPDTFLTV